MRIRSSLGIPLSLPIEPDAINFRVYVGGCYTRSRRDARRSSRSRDRCSGLFTRGVIAPWCLIIIRHDTWIGAPATTATRKRTVKTTGQVRDLFLRASRNKRKKLQHQLGSTLGSVRGTRMLRFENLKGASEPCHWTIFGGRNDLVSWLRYALRYGAARARLQLTCACLLCAAVGHIMIRRSRHRDLCALFLLLLFVDVLKGRTLLWYLGTFGAGETRDALNSWRSMLVQSP